MRKAFLVAALLLAPAAQATAQGVTAAAGGARSVLIEVREDGKVIASSTAKLQLGRPAMIPMDGPFAMRLRIDAAASGYSVRPHLTTNGPAGWTPLRSPALTVEQGRPGTTLVERQGGSPLEIAVTVN